MAEDGEPLLTPTEELILEVLAARHRTGERLWTFRSRVGPALRRLEADGYITVMGGVTEHTLRASLTDAGRRGWLSDSWVPPITTPERSDVVALLRARCEELVAQVHAMSAAQMRLATMNDDYRHALGALQSAATGATGQAVPVTVILDLIATVKDSL